METLHQVVYDDVGAAVAAPAAGRARPGDDLPEVPREGAAAAVRRRPGSWPTTSADTWTARRSAPAGRRSGSGARSGSGGGRRPPRMIGFGLATVIGLAIAGERYSAYIAATPAPRRRVAEIRLEAIDGLERRSRTSHRRARRRAESRSPSSRRSSELSRSRTDLRGSAPAGELRDVVRSSPRRSGRRRARFDWPLRPAPRPGVAARRSSCCSSPSCSR